MYLLVDGVTAVESGDCDGRVLNPTYEQVCDGDTGHAEVVRVVYDPKVTPYEKLLRLFWESHDPTQGMRQGNDTGTQYRSGIYVHSAAQLEAAEASRAAYQAERVTELCAARRFELSRAMPGIVWL